jgi:iron complex transport system substrate-binding protein
MNCWLAGLRTATFTPLREMPSVVSLISSATEMVYALGALDQLVGRSHECDYPPAVRSLPACTKPLIDVDADSRTIDEQVRNSARNAISIYEVFDDVLETLQPTHILTQVQCEVCAVSLRDVEQSVASRLASAPKLVALNPCSLGDIWNDFRQVGAAVGVDAEPVIARLQERMEALRSQSTLTVACIEWVEPLMAAGNWTPELIAMAGGTDVFGQPGVHSPWITWEQLRERDPDVIIVAPCGFDLARTRGELHWLTDRPEYSQLKAVRTGRIYLADGNQFFNRPGPRVVETLQIVAEILRGRSGEFEGVAWELLSGCERG